MLYLLTFSQKCGIIYVYVVKRRHITLSEQWVSQVDRIPEPDEFRLTRLSQKVKAGERYPWERKYAVVTQMLSLGNLRLVSELNGVPETTIRNWMASDWWSSVENEIKKQENVTLKTKLKQLIAKSLDIVQDRLENGEMVLNGKGEVVRRDVGIVAANKVANDLLQKQIALQALEQTEAVQQVSMQDTLKTLATEFAKWNLRQTTKGAIDAVYDEREEGLQEGSSEVHEQAGSSQEAN